MYIFIEIRLWVKHLSFTQYFCHFPITYAVAKHFEYVDENGQSNNNNTEQESELPVKINFDNLLKLLNIE